VIGQTIGNFEVVSHLGIGGIGEVWLARVMALDPQRSGHRANVARRCFGLLLGVALVACARKPSGPAWPAPSISDDGGESIAPHQSDAATSVARENENLEEPDETSTKPQPTTQKSTELNPATKSAPSTAQEPKPAVKPAPPPQPPQPTEILPPPQKKRRP
jgi:hypothetical protein